VGAATAVAVLASVAPAWGSFSSSTSPAGHAVASATLAAPTGLAAVNGTCVVPTSTKVNLSWTATSSTFADGYQIFRSTTSGSGYASIGIVSGRTTTTFVDTTPAFLTTYFYVVQATKNSWRSVNSAQASVTTPSPLCV
jgi:bacillopeptidase F